jgi:hypothetical protein
VADYEQQMDSPQEKRQMMKRSVVEEIEHLTKSIAALQLKPG